MVGRWPGVTRDAQFGMQGAEVEWWQGAAVALRRIWEFWSISNDSVCVCAMREEEHGYLKFKATFPSGYCVL